ncbi:hypothetical protein AaE_010403 [Aphanomyces astaci]|uniref:Uncharacterized protein n=1 Tax=Aphanomyces astaci TaxID=112090 RepID=A0A6A5A7V8_APHAT|nr:hypothetical protein AaE_010403 [Aphanomyces astaci]
MPSSSTGGPTTNSVPPPAANMLGPSSSLYNKSRAMHSHNAHHTHPSAFSHSISASSMVHLGSSSIHALAVSATAQASADFKGDFEKIDQGLSSEDEDVQHEAAKKLRNLLSSERDLLIRQVPPPSPCPSRLMDDDM